MPQLQSIASCAILFFHMIIFPTYISSIHALDRSPPAHHPYLVLQLECISNGIKGFLPSGCHFAASAARFICTKGFHPCQIPPGPTRKQCIDEQLTPFSTSQCKLTVRFNSRDCMGSFISHTRCPRTRSSASWCNSRNCTPEMISLSQQRQEKAWDLTAGQVGNLSSTSEPFAGKTHRRFPPSSLLSTIPAPGRFPAAFYAEKLSGVNP